MLTAPRNKTMVLLWSLLTLLDLALAQVVPRHTQLSPPPQNFTNSTYKNCSGSQLSVVTCTGVFPLFDGDTTGYNASSTFVWNQAFNITFTFVSQNNVSQVALFFINQPLSGVGLPKIDGLFYNNSNPLNFTILGNQDLSQNDSSVQRNISLVIASKVITRYVNLRVLFSFSSTITRTLKLNKIRLSNFTVTLPQMANLSIHSQPSIVTVSTQSSYNLSCTVVNQGSFEWNWTLPATIRYQMWTSDGTRTTILQLSNITTNYTGNYVCSARYKLQPLTGANSTIKLQLNNMTFVQPGSTSSPSPQPGPAPQDTSAGSSAAGVAIGVIIVLVLIALFVVLLVLVCLRRTRLRDMWIGEKTFRNTQINESKELETTDGSAYNTVEPTDERAYNTVGPADGSAYNTVGPADGSAYNNWKEQEVQDSTPSYEYQQESTLRYEDHKQVLMGPAKAGKLAQISDSSGLVLTANPLFEPDEGEGSEYENIDPARQARKVTIRKIKPADIEYQMGDIAVSVPAKNLIAIPEVLSPSSPIEQRSERKRCLTGPSKPGKLSTTTAIALQDMSWSVNVLYSSLECRVYDVPPQSEDLQDLCEDNDHIYSMAGDPPTSDQPAPPGDLAEHFGGSSIYANLSDCTGTVPEISPENIHEIKILGEGQFGEVLLAEIVGVDWEHLGVKVDKDGTNDCKVCVKKWKESSITDAFRKEIKFMQCLNNKNVVRLLAVHQGNEGSGPFIVMEYMENGDLCKYLQKHGAPLHGDLSPSVLLHMGTQIANGMRYLSSLNIVHRDLATRNCLVGKNYVVKISDFGMSASLYESAYCRVSGQAKLPIRWMPTESFYGQFSEKSDIWSFGVVLWEIYNFAQQLPYADLQDQALIEDATLGQARKLLTMPQLCPSEVYDIMIWCWSHDPTDRPMFEEVYRALLNCSD